MNAMAKLWRNLRLGMLVLMFLGTLFYLLATFPFAKYFSRPPAYTSEIAEGQTLVDAIYKFKAERGLWPQYLDDLAPDYLPNRPSPKWNFQILPGGPSLAMRLGTGQDLLGYDFDPATPSWRAIEGYSDRVLKRSTRPPPTTLPAATLAERQLKELDRRLVNDMGYMAHWRAKASVLRSLGRREETRQAIAQAHKSADSHFWPRLAQATIDLENPAPAASAPTATAPASLADFEQWVRSQPTFTHFYYLSLLDRQAGRDSHALADIEEAMKQPVQAGPDDLSPTALFLWDMARFALSKGKYDLVLKITDAWEKTQSYPRREEDSYLALAAAAKLAKGDPNGAAAELKKLAARKTATWAKNLDALRDAVNRRDTSFHYDPGPTPPPFQVFQLPE